MDGRRERSRRGKTTFGAAGPIAANHLFGQSQTRRAVHGSPAVIDCAIIRRKKTMNASKEFIDEKLWFTMRCSAPDKKYFLLVTNPHTFIGRMYAWDADLEQGFCVSKHEIAAWSAEVDYFIKGFLSGNEPRPPLN